MITIDTGDFVFHRPTRETWIVAYVRGDALSYCGWPDGLARLADCLLVHKASQQERTDTLKTLAASSGHRAEYARRVLNGRP